MPSAAPELALGRLVALACRGRLGRSLGGCPLELLRLLERLDGLREVGELAAGLERLRRGCERVDGLDRDRHVHTGADDREHEPDHRGIVCEAGVGHRVLGRVFLVLLVGHVRAEPDRADRSTGGDDRWRRRTQRDHGERDRDDREQDAADDLGDRVFVHLVLDDLVVDGARLDVHLRVEGGHQLVHLVDELVVALELLAGRGDHLVAVRDVRLEHAGERRLVSLRELDLVEALVGGQVVSSANIGYSFERSLDLRLGVRLRGLRVRAGSCLLGRRRPGVDVPAAG